MSEEETRSIDWDWFVMDQDGYLGHFATGGFRTLPKSLQSIEEILDWMWEYFGKILKVKYRPSVEPDFSGMTGVDGKLLDLSGFVEMAGRGLYSYDSELVEGPNAGYRLVARPPSPLKIQDCPYYSGIVTQCDSSGLIFNGLTIIRA